MSNYAFVHEGKAFTPNQTPVAAADADAHNAAIEAAELADWQTAPDGFVAYYGLIGHPRQSNATKDGVVTTWRGVTLGTITAARVYHRNFGGRMVAITVKGTNGATYYGRASWDNGTVIRLRKAQR